MNDKKIIYQILAQERLNWAFTVHFHEFFFLVVLPQTSLFGIEELFYNMHFL